LTDDDDDDMAGKGGWQMIREFESSLALRSQRGLSLGLGVRCSMLDARRSILDAVHDDGDACLCPRLLTWGVRMARRAEYGVVVEWIFCSE
jgi:hypothetical protein